MTEAQVTTVTGNGPHVLRAMNRRHVLETLRSAPSAELVADVVVRTGLSRQAVTRALDDLVATGVVQRRAPEPGTGRGRPAERVGFRADAGLVAGIDVGPRRVRVAVADIAGRVLAEHEAAVPTSGSVILRTAGDLVEQVVTGIGRAAGNLWAVGVGTPGVVDSDTGAVRMAPSLPGWAGLSVGPDLSARFDCPVLIDNDTTLAALAERTYGATADEANFVYVHWGERVGAGIVIDGRAHVGANSAAGELGFLDVGRGVDAPSDSPSFAIFDGAGSFERAVGTEAVRALALSLAEEAGADDVRAELLAVAPDDVVGHLVAVADRGEPVATAAIERTSERFASGLAALAVLLDPSTIVIGGSAARGGETLRAALTRHLGPRVLQPPRVITSELGIGAVALGALARTRDVVEDRLAAITSARSASGRP